VENGTSEKAGPRPFVAGNQRHTTLRVCILGQEPEQLVNLKEVLGSMTEPQIEIVDPATVVSGNGHPNYGDFADVVMIVLNEDESSIKHFERHTSPEEGLAVFALISEQSPALMKLALRSGADEVLFMPLRAGDATRALLKVSETRRRTEKRGGGTVCSVMSLAGGSGVTTLSINLALALRYGLKRTVAIVDLDFQAAMLAVAMDVETAHTIMALSASEKTLDSIQVEAALTQHSSGVYVLAAPEHVEDSEVVSDKTVDRVIGLLRQMFDFVVIDCGHCVNENTVSAWELSEHILYPVTQSITSARCAWRFLEVFKRLRIHGAQPQFVLNNYRQNYSISPEQVTETLARPLYAKIPRDEKAMEKVELLGKDLWQVAAGAPITRSFEELAKKIGVPAQAGEREPSGGRISRLVSSIVYRTRGASE
jgi:pilus assembly protein CpaE